MTEMQISYIYLEDEKEKNVKSYIKKLSKHNHLLSIELFTVDSLKEEISENDKSQDIFGKIIKRIENFVKEKKEKEILSGVLIDYRLDETLFLTFKSPPVAQALRNDIVDKLNYGFPVVIISSDKKIKSYEEEFSSQDLFDFKILKKELRDKEKAKDISLKLFSLAFGYKKINETISAHKSVEKILIELLSLKENGLRDLKFIDNRVYEHLLNKKNTPHFYAKFILDEFINITGYLINEDILAARLGIDKNLSSDWSKLLAFFNDAKYKGVFHEGWKRWWMIKVNEIVKDWGISSLSMIPAEERVKIIKEKTGLKNIKSANPIEYCKSSFFWTICKELKKPLATIEGFKARPNRSIKPWQDYEYYSFKSLIDKGEGELKKILLKSEFERYKKMRESGLGK